MGSVPSQYIQEIEMKIKCPRCNGKGKVPAKIYLNGKSAFKSDRWNDADVIVFAPVLIPAALIMDGLCAAGTGVKNALVDDVLCPLCNGEKLVSKKITNSRCENCSKNAGYENYHSGDNEARFCANCEGKGYYVYKNNEKKVIECPRCRRFGSGLPSRGKVPEKIRYLCDDYEHGNVKNLYWCYRGNLDRYNGPDVLCPLCKGDKLVFEEITNSRCSYCKKEAGYDQPPVNPPVKKDDEVWVGLCSHCGGKGWI